MKFSWRRFQPIYISFFILMCGDVITRAILLKFFAPPEMLKLSTATKLFLTGLRMDLAANSWVLLPFAIWLLIFKDSWLKSTFQRVFIFGFAFIFWFAQIFRWIAEYFFFEEFHSRFNTVAVDYVLYPYEVFVNIWESYPVIQVLVVCLILGLCGAYLTYKFYRKARENESTFLTRLTPFACMAIAFAFFILTVTNNTTRFSGDRSIDEISNNGYYALGFAATTRELDYQAFYLEPEKTKMYPRARALLGHGADFVNDKDTLRFYKGDPSAKKLNVVVMLEESFGSEFWGSLGRKDTLTPEMDKLSAEGILFTNLYASGNRTVRGMEGVLSSFPPLPGDSIVKRNRSDHVETLARVLKRDGYATSFLYGGRGLFDGMRSYAVRNGYDEFIEQKDFENPSFTTAWGVADEDLFFKGIDRLRELHAKGRPFFATFLSVSNHKPYTYPKGRIAENPDEERREYAVKYADWALGEFFKRAKKEDFYKDTVFVVVADHGARVYGSQKIPARSYEIPMVILGPAAVHSPQKFAGLGGSLDVAPTVMGIIGRPYQSLFFGRDLLHGDLADGRALINHNRDIGIFKNNWLVVLGINKVLDFYHFNAATRDFDLEKNPTPDAQSVAEDGMALFGVANDLYVNENYFIRDNSNQAAQH